MTSLPENRERTEVANRPIMELGATPLCLASMLVLTLPSGFGASEQFVKDPTANVASEAVWRDWGGREAKLTEEGDNDEE